MSWVKNFSDSKREKYGSLDWQRQVSEDLLSGSFVWTLIFVDRWLKSQHRVHQLKPIFGQGEKKKALNCTHQPSRGANSSFADMVRET